MIFKSKKAFDEAVSEKVEKILNSYQVKTIYEVEVSNMTKKEVEECVARLRDKLINELQLKPGTFLVIPTWNGVGQITVKHI